MCQTNKLFLWFFAFSVFVNESARRYPSSIPIMPIEKRSSIYQLIKDIHEVFTKFELQYWLHAGTLLGAVRHQASIPWDDDLDIIVDRVDEEKTLKILDALRMIGYDYSWLVGGCGRPALQLYQKHQKNSLQCDIFLFGRQGQNYVNTPPPCAAVNLRSKYDVKDVFPLRKYKFGPIYVMGPNNPIPYLNSVYPGWQTVAQIYNHSGHYNKPFTILVTEIPTIDDSSIPLMDRVDLEYLSTIMAK